MDPHRPLAEASALAPARYVEPDTYAFELDRVVATGWQVVAPAGLVSGPGDLIARAVGGRPVVILRDAEGALKGFHNVCAHRAGPLATCDRRGARRLQCGYHGWTYSLDGRLVKAPEMQAAEGFDPKQVGLRPIDVEEWAGLVFARAGDGPALAEVLDGIPGIVGETGLAGLVHHTARLYDVAANWKVYVDNYLEGYHLPFVHPGLTRLVEYAKYTTELGRWWSLQRSPVPADSGPYAAGEGLYFFVYPNTMLNFMPGRLQTNRVVPTGLDSCRIEFDFYYAPGAEGRAEADLAFTDRIQEEDRRICAHVQKGLGSGAYAPGRLSPEREAGVWHWQNLLREAYAARGPADVTR